MALAPRNSRRSSIDIWPGFVDALSQLLMVIIFILLVFTAGQFYLSAALSGRDQALQKLQQQVDELSSLLAVEKRSHFSPDNKAVEKTEIVEEKKPIYVVPGASEIKLTLGGLLQVQYEGGDVFAFEGRFGSEPGSWRRCAGRGSRRWR